MADSDNRRTANPKETILKAVLITTLLLVIIFNDKKQPTQSNSIQVNLSEFRFHVHCPINSLTDSSFLQLIHFLNINNQTLAQSILQQLQLRTTYAVFVRAFASNPNNTANSSVMLAYCGFARLKNQSDCASAKFVCSVPGPIFEAAVGEEVDIIWVNEINGTGLNWTEIDQNCYGNNSNSTHCTVDAKMNESAFDCTFNTVTQMEYQGLKKVRITTETVPISPHIHGLEMRPAFDGGSLSWFNNAGDKGPGYLSLSTNRYFNYFQQTSMTFLKGMLSTQQANSIKVMRLKNKQPPGMCFYHDHSMHATLTNNVRGTAGIYILYDPSVETNYPNRQEQYMFVFHPHNQGDLRDNSTRTYMGGNILAYVTPIADSTFLYGNESVYRNMTYRWKFLNGHFDTIYENISFAVFYEQVTDQFGFSYVKELEPPLSSPNFTHNMHQVSFSAIGADSAMFHEAIHGINQFTLAPGERLDLLVKFDVIPDNVSHVYVVAFDNLDINPTYVVKLILVLQNKTVQNKYPKPQEFSKAKVSFTNLSTLSSSVTLKRVRALFSMPIQQLFSINMHPQFTKASSQNPTIGTTEDWYIVNTVTESHPIHFHIINFQAIQQFSLKVSPSGCTLYELDFFRQSKIQQFQISNDTSLCNFLGNITLDQILSMMPQFNTYVLQDVFVNNISGKDVMERQTNTSTTYVGNCSLGSRYKYICNDTSAQIPQYYHRWKDTANVRGLHVLVLRIRWAKTNYDPTMGDDSYFNDEEELMMEFPGTVYHCHMLIHEEKMMMRPISLRMSETTKSNFEEGGIVPYGCMHYSQWANRFRCINLALSCPLPPNNTSNNTSFSNPQPRIHCPVPSTDHPAFKLLQQAVNLTDQTKINSINQSLAQTQTYIIFIRAWSQNIDNSNPKMYLLLSYCGWARWKNETNCSNAEFVCSVPGPAFVIEQGKQIQIIWLNQINATNLNQKTSYPFNFCIYPDSDNNYCSNPAKNNNTQCTYPTVNVSQINNTKKIRISPQHYPISPHIHGLQNRPTFDGNPLSWFDNAGNKGIGYNSINNQDYYNNFNHTLSFTNVSIPQLSLANLKIVKLKVNQPPGFCFYHDHSMRSTLYGVLKGLMGLFLITNSTLQAQYPSGDQQIFFVFSYVNNDDIRKYYLQKTDPFLYINPTSNSQNPQPQTYLFRNMTYWFRILNGHFDSIYFNISFALFYRQTIDANNNTLIVQLDPPLPDQYNNFTRNMHILPVTAIGADSSLYSSPIQGLTTFRMANAERLQLLVNFNTVPKNVTRAYIVCFDSTEDVGYYVIKLIINLKPDVVANKYKEPHQFGNISLSYSNLSNINSSQIAARRMQVIQSRPFDQIFTINLNFDFLRGGVSQPKIGTIQDWYLINAVPQIHPIHVHLINFQIVQQYSLKVIPEGCSLYELDYLRATNISIFRNSSNAVLCNNLQNNFVLSNYPYSSTFADYLPQGVLSNSTQGPIYGKDVMELLNGTNITKSPYNFPNCSLNTVYKYICSSVISAEGPQLLRWKDTVAAVPHGVTVIRIRWASTTYNATVDPYPYFPSFGEDQLIEFPGYVFHCHILPHEENMMMRPFMMSPSDAYLQRLSSNSSNCVGSNWTSNFQCINNKLGC